MRSRSRGGFLGREGLRTAGRKPLRPPAPPTSVPRPTPAVTALDPEGRPERPRQPVIPSSPLKRIEEQEKEQQRRNERVHISLRLTALGVVVLGLFSIMIVRLWSLQVLQGSKYRQVETNLSTRQVPISPPRGLILSRDGTVIVGDQVEAVVTLNRQVAASDPAVIVRLGAELGLTTATINADLNNQQDSIYEPVPVEVGAPDSTIVYLAEHKADFPGVSVSYVAERTYPFGDLAAQTLGYVADITSAELKQLKKYGYIPSDTIGQSGLEAQYESYLHGKPGKETLQVDAVGDPVGTPSISAPLIGDNVVLNMDVGLQEEVQTALSSQLATLRGKGLPVTSGSVVVMDPQNGAVLAMESLPTYNPAWWVGGISQSHYSQITSASSYDPLLNRAIQGLYTPGSTFKLATATAALQTGLISPYTIINDSGSFTIPGCSGGAGCTFINQDGVVLGPINVQLALTASDDVFFYTLGDWFWNDRNHYGDMPIQKYAAEYGLGQPTGVDLPGEYYGQLDSPALRTLQHKEAPKAFPYDYYGAGDNVNMAFGQGETLITPLQLADAYATFANGGTRYAPEMAAAVVSPTGRIVQEFKPRVLGHVRIDPTNYETMFQGFLGVISNTAHGTAAGAFVGYHGFPLAGKTGTATTSNNPNAQPTGLFVGFGPATGSTTAPQYVVAVIIPHAGYGAQAAAPVARQIFEYLNKHPVKPVNYHVATARR